MTWHLDDGLRPRIGQRILAGLARLGCFPVSPGVGHREGRFLTFERRGLRGGQVCYEVQSRRGGVGMGWVEWSPQWAAWRFKADPEAVFPLSGLAEIHTFMRSLGGRQV